MVNDHLDAQFFSMYLFQFNLIQFNWKKYIEKNCESSWSFTTNQTLYKEWGKVVKHNYIIIIIIIIM